jgi:hypothetical protein
MSLTDKTGASFVRFWDWAAKKGRLKKATAQSLRVAAQKILEVEENWEQVDVSGLDADELFSRFETVRASQYSPASLSTYRSRFQRALEMYLEYVRSPSSWKPGIQQRSRLRKSGATSATDQRREVAGRSKESAGQSRGAAELIEYPFPLRSDCLVSLSLPPDLRAEEARRLAAFVTALAVDE